ncbi:MAG: hypothetical protein Q9168_007281 [Polycauliona sp. 1 TL-2023]
MAEVESPLSPTSPVPKDRSSIGRASMSPLRQRASTFADMSHPLKHRRSSTFSDSVDDARQSIKSSTDDLLLPRANGSSMASQTEPSHWHSMPLALAILPAIGGVLFQNGSAIVTDISLLGLAVIFLNWAVRLPWEWYHSAQSAQRQDSVPYRREWSDDTIIEEEAEEDQDQSMADANLVNQGNGTEAHESSETKQQLDAAAELRIHELLALFACFLAPLLGGWLLHAIRSQLSRPSEGLVSNYNISLFLLASEVRPLSHLIKMVQARTLYLQRTAGAGAGAQSETYLDAPTAAEMSGRIDDLEAYIAKAPADKQGLGANGNVDQMKSEVRNSLQPDLDALNRAVRRYEKRMVALTMQMESRLQELESRMSDAITLAAAAERSSTQQRARRGSLVLLDWASSAVLLPLQAGWAIVTMPVKILSMLMGMAEDYVGNKVRREMKTAGRNSNGHNKRSSMGSRGAKKAM